MTMKDVTNNGSIKNNKNSSNQSEVFLSLDKDPDIILDFSAVNYIDTNGVKTLQHILEDYEKAGIFVYICNFQSKY